MTSRKIQEKLSSIILNIKFPIFRSKLNFSATNYLWNPYIEYYRDAVQGTRNKSTTSEKRNVWNVDATDTPQTVMEKLVSASPIKKS